MSASLCNPKFLVDENVDVRLDEWLMSEGIDVAREESGTVDSVLAATSLREERVLVTNDSDFANPEMYPRGAVYGVVWLCIPQGRADTLKRSFASLLEECDTFEDRLITLQPDSFDTTLIPPGDV